MVNQAENQTVIVGGGITGLYAAYRAVEAGYTNIHVYEAAEHLGGKIKTVKAGEQHFDMGPEFIDSTHTRLLALCKALGVALEEAPDQRTDHFQDAQGKRDSDFLKHYRPIAERILRDKEKLQRDPNGADAARFESISLADYVAALLKEPGMPKNANAVMAVILQAFSAEVGQDPKHITAAQFVAETITSDTKFLASDCGYRVKGGMQTLVKALEEHLAKRGVTFHYRTHLSSVASDENGYRLTFGSPDGAFSAHGVRAILALPAYGLAKVEGLDTLGIQQSKERAASVQYARVIKFTARFKPGFSADPSNLFGGGAQSFSPREGYRTFVVYHADSAQKPRDIIHAHLTHFAKAYGKCAEEMFDTSLASIQFENPGKSPCYSTPSPETYSKNKVFFAELEPLASKGLAIIGSYMPYEGSLGFMEGGLSAADRMLAKLPNPRTQQKPLGSVSETLHTGFISGSMSKSRQAF